MAAWEGGRRAVGGTYPVVVDRVAVPHVYVPTGPYAEILKSFGLDAVGLGAKIRELVSQHREIGLAGLP
jgi:hypothetical protein